MRGRAGISPHLSSESVNKGQLPATRHEAYESSFSLPLFALVEAAMFLLTQIHRCRFSSKQNSMWAARTTPVSRLRRSPVASASGWLDPLSAGYCVLLN